MKKSKFTESQIFKFLKENKNGLSASDLSRKYGFSPATFYNWRAKYGGMDLAEMKRLRELVDENKQLKQMYANLSLENTALRDLIEKKL